MNNQVITSSKIESSKSEGYKVIEVNINDQVENLYAVVSPVKMK